MALEVNAQDLYLKREPKVEDIEGKKIFQRISAEEKEHLLRLTDLFEKGLRN